MRKYKKSCVKEWNVIKILKYFDGKGCAGIFLLCLRTGECEEDVIIVKEGSSVQSEKPELENISRGQSAHRLIRFWDNVAEQVFREFFLYNLSRNVCCCVWVMVISIFKPGY